MARWGGIEPPTPWFVARYSIHLSYQRAGLINQGGVFCLFHYNKSSDLIASFYLHAGLILNMYEFIISTLLAVELPLNPEKSFSMIISLDCFVYKEDKGI